MSQNRPKTFFSVFAIAALLLVVSVRVNKYYMDNYGDVSAVTRATPVSQRADLARRGAPPPPDYWDNQDKYEPFRLMDLFKCE